MVEYGDLSMLGTSESREKLLQMLGRQERPEGRKIIFKELVTEDEIVEMFALRTLVYQYVNFFSFAEEDLVDNALDIDCYDLYSTFLGAFEVTENSKRLIGTVRIISRNTEHQNADYIRSLYTIQPNNSGELIRDRSFPHLETYNLPNGYYRNLFSHNSEDGTDPMPFEISRLAVLPEYWKTRDRIELGLHIMIILSSWKAIPRRNKFLIAVHPRTKRLYERIGYHVVPETEEKNYRHINQPAILMAQDLDEYLKQPNPYVKICREAYPDFLIKGYYERSNKKEQQAVA